MRVVVASDLHGVLPELPEADVLLLAGDICPEPPGQRKWLHEKFLPWLDRAPPAAIVGGNHDWALEEDHALLGSSYLEDSLTEINGLRIWGTPWNGLPSDWAFSRTPEEKRELFSLIPGDIDVLLTHVPPLGILDSSYGTSFGSPQLASRLQLSAPGLVIFGHAHEWASQTKRIGSTLFVNAGIHGDGRKRVGPLLLGRGANGWHS